jgi:DNA-binding response OmpR family regulator
MKILIIEDEKELVKSIREYFNEQGLVTEYCYTYKSAIEKISQFSYDCLLIDINLPDGSGLDVIKLLKEKNNDAGIIVISANNSIDDKVRALDMGADDYLPKPFHLSELNARLKALFRRKKFSGKNEIVFGALTLFPDEIKVLINNKTIEFTKKEFEILYFFISNANKSITKEAIASHIWGDHFTKVSSFDFIYAQIKNLRKKLIENTGIDYIKTIYGMGYKFSDQ